MNARAKWLPARAVVVRAALWLCFLAPFFYLTYGFANWLAAQKGHVPSVVFDWERSIPFLPWTILPYWSINLFYGLSLFLNDTTQQVDRLAGRYLTAQLVAVACFILFPLQATFVRTETDGLPGLLFDVLGGFDKPFNQAPSLHIALLVIIWDHLRRRLPVGLRLVWHVWCALIGASVLTTWQHHFIDIPTGALLGCFALWLFPRSGPLPVAALRLAADRRSRRLAAAYGGGALAFAAFSAIAAPNHPAALALLWPAVALAIVGFAYATSTTAVFQKDADGTVSWPSRLLLAPYRLGVAINRRAWTHGLPAVVPIADGVHLGRYPDAAEAARYRAVVDLAAECVRPVTATPRWISRPMLDLVTPDAGVSAVAAADVEAARRHGPVLVCCALGFQRSAGVVRDWLLATGRAASDAEADALLAACGRPVHLHPRREPAHGRA